MWATPQPSRGAAARRSMPLLFTSRSRHTRFDCDWISDVCSSDLRFAFGSVAGIGFGFFAYMQAVTIAPIECFAFMQYASSYWPGLYDSTTKNVTGAGFILTIILMAGFVPVNFLALAIFARVNNVVTGWKG